MESFKEKKDVIKENAIEDKYALEIKNFMAKNSVCKVIDERDKYVIENCWNDNCYQLNYKKNEDLSILSTLSLPENLLAIYHNDIDCYEFIYSPLPEKYDRKFKFNFAGNVYDAYYDKPSDNFWSLCSHFDFSKMDPDNQRFYAFYGFIRFLDLKRTEEKVDDKELFPTNFYVKGNFSKLSNEDRIEVFKHLNFYMNFYDRISPTIIFLDSNKTVESKIPSKTSGAPSDFPEVINSVKKINPTPLELFDVANKSNNARLQYIFYYQVLEYYTYYYFDNAFKSKLNSIITSPDILCSNKYSEDIMDAFRDYNRRIKDESTKMELLLSEFCTIDDIKDELDKNLDSFTKDILFDGRFIAEKLSDPGKLYDQKDLIKTIAKRLEKIRNVLVHARETRENKVISPTIRNSHLLMPYVYLIKRFAEMVAIRYQ